MKWLVLFAAVVVSCNAAVQSDLTVRVAMLQMMPTKDNTTANMQKAIDFCKKAKQQYNADIAVMPEMWSVGYEYGYPGYNRNDQSAHMAWLARAVAENSTFIETFKKLAKDLNMAIGVTYLEQYKPLPRNSISVIDRHGNLLYTYAKIHTCDWLYVEETTTPGTDFFTAQLDTGRGNITIGSMICFDREHPESARINMLKGAEIILTPNACYLDELRLSQFRIRGWENVLGVAMANYPAPFYNGFSCAFDHTGKELAMAKGDEGIYTADFNIQAMRDDRRKTIHGDANRKPLHYGELCNSNESNKFLCTFQKEPSFNGRDAFDRTRFV